jgi:hypothetical protein
MKGASKQPCLTQVRNSKASVAVCNELLCRSLLRMTPWWCWWCLTP